MTIDLDELERLAKAATPGPWEASSDEPGDVVIWGPREEWLANIGNWARQHEEIDPDRAARQYVELRDAADAAFIAAANPQTVLALVERLRLLEGIVRDLANPRTWGGSSWCRFCIGCVLGRDREAPEPAMMGMFIHDDSCPYRRAREAAK